MEQELQQAGFTGAELSWSLSCSQGDGVSFTGKWYGQQLRRIIELAYNSKIPRNVVRILEHIETELSIERISYMYSHEYTVRTIFSRESLYEDSLRVDSLLAEVEKTVNIYRIAVCKQLEKQGYEDIKYFSSEESFKENAQANEWEFYESGEMV